MRAELVTGRLQHGNARVGWIDGARGLSIVLMLVSHVDLVLGMPLGRGFHLYVMRPVAPIFIMLFAALWRPGWRRRHWQLVGAAAVAQVCTLFLFGEVPNILVLLLVGVALMPAVDRWPIPALILGVNQLAFWPLPDAWGGYPLGLLVVFLVAGHHLTELEWLAQYGRVGERLGLTRVGRQPMRWYVGHLLVLTTVSYLGFGVRYA